MGVQGMHRVPVTARWRRLWCAGSSSARSTVQAEGVLVDDDGPEIVGSLEQINATRRAAKGELGVSVGAVVLTAPAVARSES